MKNDKKYGEVRMNKKLAIFDLDGTLFDTNLVNYYSYKMAIQSCGLDIKFDYEDFKEWNGRSYKEFLPNFISDKELIEKIHNKKIELYELNLNKSKINEHLFTIIENIKNEYIIVLVTTASKKNTIQILKYFEKMQLFDLIITKEDTTKLKPDPEGFIKAMKYFNVEARNTLIFEDSPVGIEAARASGAIVFTVNKF